MSAEELAEIFMEPPVDLSGWIIDPEPENNFPDDGKINLTSGG